MRITPKTEKELQEENLIPKGVYPFSVMLAEDKQSKAGNDMIVLKLKVYNGSRMILVDDYLLESLSSKLRHAAHTMGLGESYDSGHLEAHEFDGREGWAKIGVQDGRDGYAAKNVVHDYVYEPKDSLIKPNATGGGRFANKASDMPQPYHDDSEIPF